MRHVPLEDLINTICANPDAKADRKRLLRTHKKLVRMPPAARQEYIRRNGSKKWTPIKNRLTALLGNKCWYSEVELVGGPLTIDHYRPSCDYWFLAFDAENYRVACPYSNSPAHNEQHGCAGGKGDNFPLLGVGQRATGKKKLRIETPVILDPCKKKDCDLVAFQADGRPILNPAYANDPIAANRVEQSKILLNLDHPDFNSKREQLYHEIADDVKTYEELPLDAGSRGVIRDRIKGRLAATAPFSTAARHYVQMHRNLDWVEDLLKAP